VRLNDAALAGGVPPAPPLEELGPEDGIRGSAAVAAYGRCFKPYSYVAVDYDGGVGPCNYLTGGGPGERMGSLAQSGFDEIWNAAPYRAFRRALNAGQPEREGCRWCFARRLDE
jgi:radical SAM protein with 4Fe4S-binding SPASM domain